MKKRVYIMASLMLNTSLFASQYTIQNGDSLYSIAKQNGTTVEKIKSANNITDTILIKAGKTLEIPEKDNSIARLFDNIDSTNKIEYTIQKGDSLYSIARANDISVESLLELNDLEKDSKLKIGNKLSLNNSTKPDEKKPEKQKTATSAKTNKSTQKYKVDESKLNASSGTVQQNLGKRYVWGATGPNTFDCSGLSTYVYKQKGVSLPRTANAQSRVGQSIDRESLLPGDLVFFDTSRDKTKGVNHVGIYVGNNRFVHASSAKHQVIETSLDSAFYRSSYRGAKRVKS